MQNLFQELVELLSADVRLVSEGKLMKNKVVELALNLDPMLLKHLLKSESLKKHFFGVCSRSESIPQLDTFQLLFADIG